MRGWSNEQKQMLSPGSPRTGRAASPHISPIRLSLSDICLLSMSYGGLFTMASLHTALDAFIAPFPGRNSAGGLRRANRLSCRFVSLVFLRLTGTCSLNHSHRYAFGPRIKYGAGSGTRQPQKSSAIFAPIGEICGLAPHPSSISVSTSRGCEIRKSSSVLYVYRVSIFSAPDAYLI